MKKWHLVIVVALCIGLATTVYAFGPGHRYAAAGWGGHGPCYGGPGFGGGPLAGLDLTKEQASQLWQIREKHHSDTRSLRYEMFQKRLELRKLYADPKADEALMLAKQKEINTLQQKMADKRAQLQFEERKVLTPDQIKKLNEMNGGPGYGFHGFGGRGFGPCGGCGQRALGGGC
ncbi:MAG: zinc resistance protein [Syntrophorhabdus sp. PtaU1.Bin153]|nr:MAG: zinc resistance protein [Syntrophorhabdus sp. PtaU1.Bin153]